MTSPDVLPQNATLTFFLRTEIPEAFPRDEKIEIATENDSVHGMLSLAGGTLNFQDAKTVMGVLDAAKASGTGCISANCFCGPLRLTVPRATGNRWSCWCDCRR